jgi:acyl dehydratase
MTTLTFETMKDMTGKELGVSPWVEVTQDKINQFADCTGDHQWIHVDVERARKHSPFGAPIAHGYLSLSLIGSLAQQVGAVPKGVAAAFNYGLDKVRFLAPVKAGAKVRLRVTLVSLDQKEPGQFLMKTSNVMEIEGSDKPALIAETLAMLIAAPPKA